MAVRPDKTTYYLEIAAAVAARSTCVKKRYGAVIVKNDRIVATGYNGSPRGEANCCDLGCCYADTHGLPREVQGHGAKYGTCVAVHAEQNAMLAASAEDMQGAVMYLYCWGNENPEPCNICDRMIRNAGIKEIICYGTTEN